MAYWSTMELNLNIPFKDLEGVPGGPGDITQDRIVAQLLANQTKGNSIKFLDWAMTLYAHKPVSIDKSDFVMLRDLIEASEQLPAISKAQILQSLDAAKAEAK